MADQEASALKEIFNLARYRQTANLLAAAHPGFDRNLFLKTATNGLDELSLLQRMRRMSEACRATLPGDFVAALAVLKRIASKIDRGFVTLFLSDFVGLYGQDHFDESMAALALFTRLGSAEFAIREFLRRNLKRTLAVMREWSKNEDEHLRRLASEGCRPRLPWSFRLEALVADPSPVLPILENLKADSSLYVRKSVANHLNDISKDHPNRLFQWTARWDRDNPHTRWIIKRALRTLIKQGDRRALTIVGARRRTAVELSGLTISPRSIAIGKEITFSFHLRSKARTAQKLIVDYIVHYVKNSGRSTPKVFKLRELSLAAAAKIPLRKNHRLQELTTRRHYPGRHRLEIAVNGVIVGSTEFLLTRS